MTDTECGETHLFLSTLMQLSRTYGRGKGRGREASGLNKRERYTVCLLYVMLAYRNNIKEFSATLIRP